MKILIELDDDDLQILSDMINDCEYDYRNLEKDLDKARLVRRLKQNVLDARDHKNELTNKAIKNLRREGWDNAREAIRMIPCWITDKDHHGFDLWEDENGYAQESGARIVVMEVLDDNPYSENYVDPKKHRELRVPRGTRRVRKKTNNGE